MAKFHKSSTKGKTVPHKILTERGEHLSKTHLASQGGSINRGQSIVIENGVVVQIGEQCPKCRKRVRGLNHTDGNHHRGVAVDHRRR